jgi:hypothetical protein
VGKGGTLMAPESIVNGGSGGGKAAVLDWRKLLFVIFRPALVLG